MLRRFALVMLFQSACTAALNAPRADHGVAYVNGKWFDGTRFHSTTMYTADGLFLGNAPKKIDSTVDLGGGFGVPPFGDAHQHLIDPRIDATIAAFMHDGIFYVKDMGNAPIMRPSE